MSELIKNLPHSTTLTLADQLSVQEGQVSSLTLAQQPGCKVTLFAIDTDEGMSSHAAPGDASSSASRAAGRSPSRACSTCFSPGSPSS